MFWYNAKREKDVLSGSNNLLFVVKEKLLFLQVPFIVNTISLHFKTFTEDTST